MFTGIDVNCLPHPGLFIQREDDWTLRQLESVFVTNLEPVRILGNEMSPLTCCHVIRDFVAGFQNAAPEATTFCEALKVSSVLMVKEKVMKDYEGRIRSIFKKHPSGLDPIDF